MAAVKKAEMEENVTGLFVFLYPLRDEKHAVQSDVVGSLRRQNERVTD